MTTETIHTCSYYCERPECVRRQRDELRDRMESALAQQPAAVDEFVTIDGKRYDVDIVRTALPGLASDPAAQQQEAAPMADVELLPLPSEVRLAIRAYARACAEANLAPLQAENERLRAEVDALKAENEMLREALKDADSEMDWLDEDMDTCDHSVGVCMCSYWNMRRNMKATLSKGNNND